MPTWTGTTEPYYIPLNAIGTATVAVTGGNTETTTVESIPMDTSNWYDWAAKWTAQIVEPQTEAELKGKIEELEDRITKLEALINKFCVKDILAE